MWADCAEVDGVRGDLAVNPLRDDRVRAQALQGSSRKTLLSSAMVTFWLRQDQQDTGLAEAGTWLLDEWPPAAHGFRILPAA